MGRFFKGKEKNKRTLNLLVFLLFVLLIGFKQSFAQSYIELHQDNIDALDGQKDHAFNSGSSLVSYCYFVLVDSLQEIIQKHPKLKSEDQKKLLEKINLCLILAKPNQIKQVEKDKICFEFLVDYLNLYSHSESMLDFLNKDQNKTLLSIGFIYFLPETGVFLNQTPNNFIDQILYQYKEYQQALYAQALIERLVLEAPLSAKKYFVSTQAVYKALLKSDNQSIKLVLEINKRYRRNTKAYVLLQSIVDNELSITQAHELGNSENYFKKLLEIRRHKHPLAALSLDRELQYIALEYVRKVNGLHDETNQNYRFAAIKKLNAEAIYALLVYSEDEIFTSSFNGVYERLMQQIKNEEMSSFSFLKSMRFNRLNVFIKMLSYYGFLDDFLKTMPATDSEWLLKHFINKLDHIEDAISIVNAISAIENKAILKLFEEELLRINLSDTLSANTQLNYALISKLFAPKTQIYKYFFDSIALQYPSLPIEKIEQKDLLGTDSTNVQRHFFYDDEDGIASYNSFINSFKNSSHWNILYEKSYVKIISKNKRVKIYANKPKYERSAGMIINAEIEKNREEIEFIIHRGHSYYVDYTINAIPKSSKLILLGSCGGYNKLSELLQKSNNAHIISTKQIGSMAVNNPLIFKLSEKIRLGEILEWKTFWDDLKLYFKDKARAKARFEDYVAPHQNLGAQFMILYYSFN